MWSNLPLFPEQASTIAPRIDALYYFLIAISAFFTGLISLLLLYFAVRYRRRSEAEQPRPILGGLRLELVWTLIPFILVMIIFVWGARLFVTVFHPPANAMEVAALGKQWMWQFQHPDGRREINALHVPTGQPVKLTLTSQDVVHSFYVPAFRVKMDAVPGRYTTAWFEATKLGTYHLFCAEYCGTAHAGMVGQVIVMTPTQYQEWLSGGSRGEPLTVAGERLFQQLGCATCHRAGTEGRGPALTGVFGTTVQLQSGETVTADESYLRESILNPRAKIVAGYQPIMPTFQGQMSEEELFSIIAYVRSLGSGKGEGSIP